jgi:multidrug efflux pump subunit AcrB
MTYISTAANDGSANISVYFGLGTDPDIAAVMFKTGSQEQPVNCHR